jgi:hypothetical protein
LPFRNAPPHEAAAAYLIIADVFLQRGRTFIVIITTAATTTS